MTEKYLEHLKQMNLLVSNELSHFDNQMFDFLKDNLLNCQGILYSLGMRYAILREENDNSFEFETLDNLFKFLKLSPEFGEDEGELIFYGIDSSLYGRN